MAAVPVENNLWLARSACNSHKCDSTTGLDPLSGEIVPLFNPRSQSWYEHFTWTTGHDYVIGRTAIGRATVASLKLNRPLLVRARRLWVRPGVRAPQGVGPNPPHP